MTISILPIAVFFVGALIAAVTRGVVRSVAMLAVPLIAGWGLFNLYTLGEAQTTVGYSLFGYALTLVRADALSLLFALLFVLASFLCIIFSLHLKDTVQHVSGLLYAGSAIGAVFAGDLVTLFIFWELLAVTSVFLIVTRPTARAQGAAMRYLLVQILSGLLLLSGILIRFHQTGSLAFTTIGTDSLAGWLILIAFGIKCGFPLLHNWLTDAYPEATATGMVFLSAFTTKVAVYSLARGFAGTEFLIYVGATMTMFPIFFAVIENDLRRVLSYSMINQIGFMVCGIGLGTQLALNGAVSHAFNDVIFKALMLMAMGAVMFRTGKIKASDLGGLYKSMPWTATFCIVGAASISAFPLFSGFVSKSMVMASALEEGHPAVWLALLFASAGVMEHAGIKIPYFTFFAHDSGIRVKEAPANMMVAMAIAAFICIFNGAYPWVLYSLLPFPVDFVPYTASHVLTQLQLLLFACLAFVMLNLYGVYPPELPSVNLDFDWFYRRLMPRAVKGLMNLLAPVDRGFREKSVGAVRSVISVVFDNAGPNGILARTNNARSMVVWVLVLLAFYVIFYFS